MYFFCHSKKVNPYIGRCKYHVGLMIAKGNCAKDKMLICACELWDPFISWVHSNTKYPSFPEQSQSIDVKIAS